MLHQNNLAIEEVTDTLDDDLPGNSVAGESSVEAYDPVSKPFTEVFASKDDVFTCRLSYALPYNTNDKIEVS